MSQQGLRQASVRAESGTTLTYEGDWHALWDGQDIEEGTFNERLLLYCNEKLGVTFTNINDAMQALAIDQGATNFGSMGTFDASLGAALLIDTLSTAPARAYSTRKLKSDYAGSAIRIRRSSDNAEQDIGFSGEGLDTAAITTFVGANSAYLAKWYDQSGNADDMVNATAAEQLRIVDTGTIDVKNTKPVAFCNTANNGGHYMAATVAHTVKEAVGVCAFNAATFNNYVAVVDDAGSNILLIGDAATANFYTAGIFTTALSVDNGANAAKVSGTLMQVRGNNSTGASCTLQLSKQGATGDRFWPGWIGEAVTWSTELSAGDRTTLYNNQKAYWGTA